VHGNKRGDMTVERRYQSKGKKKKGRKKTEMGFAPHQVVELGRRGKREPGKFGEKRKQCIRGVGQLERKPHKNQRC